MSRSPLYSRLPEGDDDVHITLLSGSDGKREDPFDPMDRDALPHRSKSPYCTVLLALVAAISALAACLLTGGRSVVVGMQELEGLRQPTLYPNYDRYLTLLRGNHRGPGSMFPRTMLRASRSNPIQFYEASNHVYLSESDSMFFDFHLAKDHAHSNCYVSILVPTPEDLANSPKDFLHSGDISGLRVYNVTNLNPEQRRRLSWETRPRRIGELGQINFTNVDPDDEWRLHKPTPRFKCETDTVYTVEITCDDCTLEFEETFVLPALGFEVSMIA